MCIMFSLNLCFELQLAMTVYNLCTSNGEAFPGHDTLLKIG